MPRPLQAVDSSDSAALWEALDSALQHDGPAVFPTPKANNPDIPSSVDSEVVLVVETSGSTSRPKRVWHTEHSLRAAAEQVNGELGGGNGVWWQTLPAHYIAGVMILIRAMYSGAAVITRRPEQDTVESLLDFADHTNADTAGVARFTSLVPQQLAQLIDASRDEPSVARALSGFSQILVGGQRVPDNLMNMARDLGLAVSRTYGAAETAGGCVWDGKPLSGTELCILHNRIALSGPMLAGGYLGDPKRTARSFVNHGGKRWFVSDDTGDISNGLLSVTGRTDRVIISGGVKTNLDEVEAALQEQYGVTDVVVLSVLDSTWGESIGVVSGHELDYSTVKGFLRGKFGKAARLAWAEREPYMPRLSTGKIDRRELGRRYSSPTASRGAR